MGGSLNVKMWHVLGMWLIIVFAIIHIYMAVRSDIMGRESCVSTMIGGWRYWKDDRP
jgi:Ni/Fe-hydrogenase 1 B-type cytochrome subunit